MGGMLSAFQAAYAPPSGGFGKCEYAVDACLLHGFGETGEVGAVGAMGEGFDEHGRVQPGNHAGLAGDNEFERSIAGGGAEDVGEDERAVVGRGAGEAVLGALDDGGVSSSGWTCSWWMWLKSLRGRMWRASAV